VIDAFRRGEATFLTPRDGAIRPNTYVDITHESLIRQWKKLRDEWLPEEQLSAKTLVDLVGRARSWKAKRRELLVGLDLTGISDWDRRRNKSSAWAEHYVGQAGFESALEFIAASRAKERKRVLAKRALWIVALAVVLGDLSSLLSWHGARLPRRRSRLFWQSSRKARKRLSASGRRPSLQL
jgi:hypothetical protein